MARSIYSEQLMDALMMGDNKRVEELNLLIAKNAVKPTPQKSATIIANTTFTNNNTPAMKLNKFMVDKYGDKWFEDELETIDALLLRDYAVDLSNLNRDKLHALRHINRSINPYTDWYEFNQVALALAGVKPDFEAYVKPSPGMMINAVMVLKELQGDEKFSEQVVDYITISLINDGIYVPPPLIADTIAYAMREMTNEIQLENWVAVESMINSGSTDETTNGIQARRLILAESAAKKYFS